jgi:DNA-binding transcriptional ArsR family regulator
MVKYMYQAPTEEINLIFHSLSDPTRRGILERLTIKDLTVTEIAEPYEMSLPAVSKHLKILEHAKLIGRKKQGREYQIHLEPQALKTVEAYIDFYKKFWNTRFSNLEKFLQGGNT